MAHACAGRVFCIRVFPKGFGRPHQRARVKEARPLYADSILLIEMIIMFQECGLFVIGLLIIIAVFVLFYGIFAHAKKSRVVILGLALFIWGAYVHCESDSCQKRENIFLRTKQNESIEKEKEGKVLVVCNTELVNKEEGKAQAICKNESVNKQKDQFSLPKMLRGVNCSLSAFFPSRGDFEEIESVNYFLFHIAVVFFVVNVLISFWGDEFINTVRLLWRSLICRGRDKNVFWVVNEESETVASSISPKKDVLFVVDVNEESYIKAYKRNRVHYYLEKGWTWAYLNDPDLKQCDFGVKIAARGNRHFFLGSDGHKNVALAESVIQAYTGPKERSFYVRVSSSADDDIIFKWADRWNSCSSHNVNVVIVREEALTSYDFLLRNPMLKCPGVKINTKSAKVSEGEFRVLVLGYGVQGATVLNDMICDSQLLNETNQRVRFSADIVDINSASFGAFKQRCKDAVNRFNLNFWCMDAGSDLFWEWLEKRLAEMPYNRIVVCLRDDRQNICLANDIGNVYKSMGYAYRDVVFARVRNSQIDRYIDSTFAQDDPNRIFLPFGSLKKLYVYETIVRPRWERGAIWLNGDYMNDGDAPHDEEKDLRHWRCTSFFNRESTRASFFNQRNFLMLLGYRITEENADNTCFDENDPRNRLDVLAENEHLRWMAWHFVRGIRVWRPTKEELETIALQNDGKVRHNRIKELNAHADLVEFGELPKVDELFGTKNTQGKDRRFVRSEAMRRSNIGIVRV